jgi:hypothetical protein
VEKKTRETRGEEVDRGQVLRVLPSFLRLTRYSISPLSGLQPTLFQTPDNRKPVRERSTLFFVSLVERQFLDSVGDYFLGFLYLTE